MPLPPRLAYALLIVSACSAPDSRIPALDGSLALEIRYPRPGEAAPAEDSVALWGTVGTGRAKLMVNRVRVNVEPNGTFSSFLALPPGRSPSLRFVSHRGNDSVVRTILLRRGTPNSSADEGTPVSEGTVREWGRWVTMRRLLSDTADRATQLRPIYSRWRPGGEVAIPIPQGVRLFANARTNRSIRLRLASDEQVWVPLADADTTARARPMLLRAGPPQLRSDSTEMLISLALPERLPSTVELSGDRLLWTVYGAEWTTRPASRDGDSAPIRRIVPRHAAPGRVVVDVGLVSLPLGWRTEWREGALHLRVRRAPLPSKSLHGLVVALDPGHPPDGTTGPSGLSEDSVTLAVALVAADKLRQRGATVILTRTSGRPLSLEARAVVAEQSRAHLFISLHLNAPGPGRPPSAVYGTQTYWMNANGSALARLLLVEVSKAMGQPAIGMYQGEFAVLRPAWTAAALVEGSGIVIPEREAFLRTQAGVDAYAQGVVNGIVRWNRAADARALPVSRRR